MTERVPPDKEMARFPPLGGPLAKAVVAKSPLHLFTVDEVGFFEGAEKLLEMWFHIPQHSANNTDLDADNKLSRGLRVIPKTRFDDLLDLVQCKILSVCRNESMDAYLLSESSMFVSHNRIILKTCGTTTPLHAIQPLIALVREHFPATLVMGVFYSHRNFQKPKLQFYPHNSFDEEVQYLDKIFDDGAAYALGRLYADTWYLYSMDNSEKPLDAPDQTLEILMTDLDPRILALFSSHAYPSAEQLAEDAGLSDLFPGAILDAKMFEPCGYSLNAIIQGDTYFSVHVTPQFGCSYVSFETNIELDSYSELINKVTNIFQPGKFSISLFASKSAKCGSSFTAFDDCEVDGYQCQERQFCTFVVYTLTFARYVQRKACNTITIDGQVEIVVTGDDAGSQATGLMLCDAADTCVQ